MVSKLISNETRQATIDEEYAEYDVMREKRLSQTKRKTIVPIEVARENRCTHDWENYTPFKPNVLGRQVFDDYPLEDLVDRIDWTPFFRSWELHGRYPDILDDRVVGEEARKLFADGKAMLQTIISEKWLTAKAVMGLFPANTVNHDDIELYTDESRTQVEMTTHHLRMQLERVGKLLPHHHVTTVHLIALRACTIVHRRHGVIDQAHNASINRSLTVIIRRGIENALKRLRHRNGTPSICEHLEAPGLEQLGHCDLVSIRPETSHVFGEVRVQVNDLLQVLKRSSVESRPRTVGHLGTELVTALIGVLVGRPVLRELHAAAAAPE